MIVTRSADENVDTQNLYLEMHASQCDESVKIICFVYSIIIYSNMFLFSIISIMLMAEVRSLHVRQPPRKPICYKFNVTVSILIKQQNVV